MNAGDDQPDHPCDGDCRSGGTGQSADARRGVVRVVLCERDGRLVAGVFTLGGLARVAVEGLGLFGWEPQVIEVPRLNEMLSSPAGQDTSQIRGLVRIVNGMLS